MIMKEMIDCKLLHIKHNVTWNANSITFMETLSIAIAKIVRSWAGGVSGAAIFVTIEKHIQWSQDCYFPPFTLCFIRILPFS